MTFTFRCVMKVTYKKLMPWRQHVVTYTNPSKDYKSDSNRVETLPSLVKGILTTMEL